MSESQAHFPCTPSLLCMLKAVDCYRFKWSSSVLEMPTTHTHEKHEPPASAGQARGGERQEKTATGNR